MEVPRCLPSPPPPPPPACTSFLMPLHLTLCAVSSRIKPLCHIPYRPLYKRPYADLKVRFPTPLWFQNLAVFPATVHVLPSLLHLPGPLVSALGFSNSFLWASIHLRLDSWHAYCCMFCGIGAHDLQPLVFWVLVNSSQALSTVPICCSRYCRKSAGHGDGNALTKGWQMLSPLSILSSVGEHELTMYAWAFSGLSVCCIGPCVHFMLGLHCFEDCKFVIK